MTRGTHALAAANRRLHEANQRIAELERELAATKSAARRREVDLQEQLTRQGYDVAARTASKVQELMIGHTEQLADGLSSAAWHAQRLAMTEHLTWLFLKGYVTWDRMEGDKHVLQFIATHGSLKAWFVLTGKYAWFQNHDDRRYQQRIDPVRQMLGVLRDINRAEKDQELFASRQGLDDVVKYARDSFINVELRDILTDDGWVVREPTDEEMAMHREITDSMPEFQALAERVG